MCKVLRITFILILAAWSVLSAEWFLYDKKDNLLCFDWVTAGDLHEEEQIYLKSFKELYKDLPETYFGPLGLTVFLQKMFAEERAELDKRYFVSVKKDGRVIGFASFEKTAQEHEVYLKLIVVDATCKRCGIGEELILTILKKLPDVQRIVLDTRKLNQGGISFYKKLGFKECPCIDKTIPAEHYTGFAGDVDELMARIERLREP